jgi:amino-acid N-acetyltransferase
MTPTFRPATAADEPAVTQLLIRQSLPTAGVAEMFAQDATQFIVGEADGELVAVAGVEECCEHALLRSVAVRGDWQRRGLGHSLVERAVAQGETRGIQALYLLTLTAEAYFPRFGFARVDRAAVPPAVAKTVEFTSACPASAITMAKSLVGVR